MTQFNFELGLLAAFCVYEIGRMVGMRQQTRKLFDEIERKRGEQ